MEIHDLVEKQSRQAIAAEEWNAIVKSLKGGFAKNDAASGSSGDDASGVRSSEHHVVAVTESELEAYSVFGVINGESAAGPTQFKVDRVGHLDRGSPSVLYTNGVNKIGAGGKFMARPIAYYSPAILRIDGDDPVPGCPCGVNPGTYGVSAGKSCTGMICLATYEIDEVPVALVMRAFEASAMIGMAVGTISAMNVGTKTLGSGIARVLYADPDDGSLVESASPCEEGSGTSDWDLPVWSASFRAIEDGLLVGITPTLGVGLVVTPLECPPEGSS